MKNVRSITSITATVLAMLSAAMPVQADGARAEIPTHLSERQRTELMRQYLTEQRYRHADQYMAQQREYGSDVGQGASNQGGAQGHSLGQQQGDVGVGGLVNGGDVSGGAPAGSMSYQYAPQSNSLTVGQDNYAPVQLSNIAASNGSVHIGDIYQGNMYNSQIGNNQQGGQQGDTANQQINDQTQNAASNTGSSDQLQN